MSGPESESPKPSPGAILASITLVPFPPLRSVFPEFLRFLYLIFLPIAGCALIRVFGTRIGQGWGLGIAIGLFLYHYLLWALFVTERLDSHRVAKTSLMARWSWVISPLLVLFVVRGDLTDWLVEQSILETGTFTAAIALLALRKCADEGKEAPWFLAIAVFVLPSAALLFKLGSFWFSRREGVLGWSDLLFGVAAILSLTNHHRRIQPYILGHDQLVEPLSTGGKTVLAAVWFVGLLGGGILLGA